MLPATRQYLSKSSVVSEYTNTRATHPFSALQHAEASYQSPSGMVYFRWAAPSNSPLICHYL
jgi:hypothetical protein